MPGMLNIRQATEADAPALLAIYAPATLDPRIIEHHAALAGQRMVEFNGGQTSDILALTV